MNILDLLASGESILGLVGTSNAPTDANKFMMPRGTLVFLQLAYTQAFKLILRTLLNTDDTSTNIYLLYGCVAESKAVVGASTTYIFSPGAVYYKGEIFLYDGGQVTVPTGTDPYISIVTTYYTGDGKDADPVTYTDSSVHYIHNIRKINITASPANNIGQYDIGSASPQVIPFTFNVPPPPNITGSGVATISGYYPNITVSVPQLLNPVVAAGSFVVGNSGDVAGATNNPYLLPVPAGSYYVMGTLRGLSNSPQNDASVTWSVIKGLDNSYSILFNENGGPRQVLRFDYIVFQN